MKHIKKHIERRCLSVLLVLAGGALPAALFAWSGPATAARAAAARAPQPRDSAQPGRVAAAPETAARGAALELQGHYGILLDDADRTWTERHARELLAALRTMPLAEAPGERARPSRWELAGELHDDIEIAANGASVRLSAAAFGYATARRAESDGVPGRLSSKRLHHALLRFVTDGGRDRAAVEHILGERFGVSTRIRDYAALTASTTVEGAASFQPFRPAELLLLIEQLEELPPAMQRVAGLEYFVRRADGTPHPHTSAPAVAWTSAGYVEFMEQAFAQASVDDVQRLILHETAHFLWALELSPDLREAWAEVGGWYANERDPDRWSTSDQTGFVDAYAHARNPDEDLAECVAHYVMNPALLHGRAPAKYEFLRDHVLPGTTYAARIDPSRSFEVRNLAADEEAPGRIRLVDVRLEGARDADKLVTIVIELLAADAVHGGAESASMRVFSETGTYVDVRLLPTDDSGSVLSGTFELSRYAKSGTWRSSQIVLRDAVGNQRFCGVDDFHFELIVDSPLEDLRAPRYVPGSASLVVVSGARARDRTVRAEWRFEEDRRMKSGFATLALRGGSTRSLQSQGTFDEASGRFVVEWHITDQHPAGTYELAFLSMTDAAGNRGTANLVGDARAGRVPSVTLRTSDPDLDAPQLDLDALEVSARPLRPNAPDGATRVKIVYVARDDKSGLGTVSYKLRDPRGVEHFAYHYHENFYTSTFVGDPQAWKTYEIEVLLPAGSAPGTWGISSMVTADKVGHTRYHDFVEILHFEVDAGRGSVRLE